MDTAAEDTDTQDPVFALHLLGRLLALICQAPVATASFYAEILLALFPPDVIERLNRSDALADNPVLSPQASELTAAATEKPSGDSQSSLALAIDTHIAVHIRATCYMHAKEYYSAITLVRDQLESDMTSSGGKQPINEACPGCARILGRSCHALGRHDDASHALLSFAGKKAKLHSESHCAAVLALSSQSESDELLMAKSLAAAHRCRSKPLRMSDPVNASAGGTWIRQLAQAMSAASTINGQPHKPAEDEAAACFEKALRSDSWLWEAWTGWCSATDAGSAPHPPMVFAVDPLPAADVPEGLLPAHLCRRLRGSPQVASSHIGEENVSRALSPSAGTHSSDASTSARSFRKLSPLPQTRLPTFAATPIGAISHRGAIEGGSSSAHSVGQAIFGATPGSHGRPGPWAELSARNGSNVASPFQPTATSTPTVGSGVLDRTFLPSPILPIEHLNSAANSLSASRSIAQKRARGPVEAPTRHNLQLPRLDHSIVPKPKKRPAASRMADPSSRLDRLPDAPVRRSSRLQAAQSDADPHTNDEGIPAKNLRTERLNPIRHQTSRGLPDYAVMSASGDRTPVDATPQDAASYQTRADTWLAGVMRRYALAHAAMMHYNSNVTLSCLNKLPETLRKSPTSLSMFAKTYSEMLEYGKARRVYDRLREIQPCRVEDMEHFATLLWHLGDAPALSHLAQELIAINRESAQAWIATGNCFSLQREYDEAMRCFKRAISLTPQLPYAYTLAGHEAVEMEEYERATSLYHSAIRADALHYNAWYGLGLVYQKTGKTRYAEYYFRRAAQLNPTNAVLQCCVGMILEKRRDYPKSLHVFDQALALSPANHMVRFRRVRILVTLNRWAEALPDLEALAAATPLEANVMLLLGKVYQLVGNKEKSTIAFTAARDLNPKLAGSIKAFVDREEQEGDGASIINDDRSDAEAH